MKFHQLFSIFSNFIEQKYMLNLLFLLKQNLVTNKKNICFFILLIVKKNRLIHELFNFYE